MTASELEAVKIFLAVALIVVTTIVVTTTKIKVIKNASELNITIELLNFPGHRQVDTEKKEQ